MLSFVLQSSTSSSALPLIACLSRRTSGCMRLIHFTALALLAGSALANPISPPALQKRQYANALLPAITPTSIDSGAAAVSDIPTFGACKSFYYDPKDDVPCGVVARQFSIFLIYPEYDQPSTAQWCETFLSGNGICRKTSPNSPSAYPTAKPSTLSVSTVMPTAGSVELASGSITAVSVRPTGSPVNAIVSLNGSIVSLGPSPDTIAEMPTRGPVVLASVRANEYSSTVMRTASRTTSVMDELPTDDPTASAIGLEGSSPPSTSASRPAVNTTRMISYDVGSGNATSLKTVLVTAHMAADAVMQTSPTSLVAASPSLLSATNSTLALRTPRPKRQAPSATAMFSIAATYQVVNAQPTDSLDETDLITSATASVIAPSLAAHQDSNDTTAGISTPGVSATPEPSRSSTSTPIAAKSFAVPTNSSSLAIQKVTNGTVAGFSTPGVSATPEPSGSSTSTQIAAKSFAVPTNSSSLAIQKVTNGTVAGLSTPGVSATPESSGSSISTQNAANLFAVPTNSSSLAVQQASNNTVADSPNNTATLGPSSTSTDMQSAANLTAVPTTLSSFAENDQGSDASVPPSSATLVPSNITSGSTAPLLAATSEFAQAAPSILSETAKSGEESVAAAAGACPPTPLPTLYGGVANCAKWHVVTVGDTCEQVTALYKTDMAGFLALNPTVDAECKSLLNGFAYCVASCDGVAASATSTVVRSPYARLARTGEDIYVPYHGDGTSEQGWPNMTEWMSWNDLVSANQKNLASGCRDWVVQENSPEEIDMLLGVIPQVAEEGGLDSRAVLAVILQESHGCLRVPSTMGSHQNPGILQSHAGQGSCNTNIITAGETGPMKDPNLVQANCSSAQIVTMVRDGALGTQAGDGLLQLMKREQENGYRDAQMWYRVVRGYNSGSVDVSKVLELGASTHSYVSDIANRLVGWKTGPSTFA